MSEKILNPPKFLKRAGRRLWRGVLRDFEVTENHDLELLAQAAQCCDRIEQARDEIKQAGAFYTDRWKQPRPHPGHTVEKDNKILLCRILRELNLSIEPRESRPPSLY